MTLTEFLTVAGAVALGWIVVDILVVALLLGLAQLTARRARRSFDRHVADDLAILGPRRKRRTVTEETARWEASKQRRLRHARRDLGGGRR